MRWLIVEDALKDRKGHWFEYLCGFNDELRALGDEVDFLVDRTAEPFILERLPARPVMPESIWRRMNDGSGKARRYGRVVSHAWNTRTAIAKWLKKNPQPDVVFVPSVLVHHLLGWAWLVKTNRVRSRVLLFFPNVPIYLDAKGEPHWAPSPTTRLMAGLFNWLKPELKEGRVILGVETQEMRQAMAKLTGLPISYFPHPVASFTEGLPTHVPNGKLQLASYGFARHEKGSDIMVKAISAYLQRFPDTRVHFTFQWPDDFHSNTGALISVDKDLLSNKKVEVIQRYFADGEYPKLLEKTDAMLLPYRLFSYGLRVSRVAIEAMVNGVPVVATSGTTLSSQAREFGAEVSCVDGDVESLVQAIREIELRQGPLRKQAVERCVAARRHFSVRTFRDSLASPIQTLATEAHR